ncbi:MAG: CAP domain-containing protein [Spirochaetia bacterium]
MRVLLLIFLVCGSRLAVAQHEAQLIDKEVGTVVDQEQHVLNLILSTRKQYGIDAPLLIDLVASEVSDTYAQTLSLGELRHMDPYGRNSVGRYRQDGGSALSTGEILGRGTNIQSIIEYWLKSPTHRQILLGSKWTAVGVGVRENAGFYTIAVLFTTSISEDRSYEWQGNHLSIYVTLRDGITPQVWLQSGSAHVMPNQVKEDKFLVFNVQTNGPERVLIFNANGQGDVLVVPARGN